MNKNRKIANGHLVMRSCVDRVMIKCYEEQMPDGWEVVQELIRNYPKEVWQILAIKHYKDPTDGIWEDSFVKPHYHIIIRSVERYPEGSKKGKIKQVHVSTFLNKLGIVYRPDLDKTLWEEHGVEYCRDFSNATLYLPHWSEDAKRKGKQPYDLEEIVSNLSIEEIKQIMDGYTRVTDSVEKVTPRKLAELDEEAYELGYNLGDYDSWYSALPFNIRSQAKMKTIKESYDRGVTKRLEEGKNIARLCVFVQGEKNMGKTYAAEYSLKALGKKFLNVSGGGTGKFDNLKLSHDAIVVDDDICPNLLNMSDSKYCRAYRRNSNNPVWIGDILIITSNLKFRDWLSKCGIDNEENIKAAESRFFICHLEEVDGNNVLVCTSPAKRGSVEVKRKLLEMYKAFRKLYDESLSQYHPSDSDVDYADLNGEAYNKKNHIKTAEKQAKAREMEQARLELEKKKQLEERKRRHAFYFAKMVYGRMYNLTEKEVRYDKDVERIANYLYFHEYRNDQYYTVEMPDLVVEFILEKAQTQGNVPYDVIERCKEHLYGGIYIEPNECYADEYDEEPSEEDLKEAFLRD